MKRIVLVAALALLPGCWGRPSTAEINREVKEVRRLHGLYRGYVVAKEPAQQSQVEEVASNIERTLANLETLTGE